MSRNLKVLLFVLAVLVIAGGSYAFAASNTVDASAAGYKATTIDGYQVQNIVYDLDDTDPTVIDAIAFHVTPLDVLAPAAATVKIQTVDGGSWTDCTLASVSGSTMGATCPLGAVRVDAVTALNIVASSSIDPTPAP